MPQIERSVCDVVGALVAGPIDRMVAAHWSAVTQEHQLTSRIAGVVDALFDEVGVFDYRIRIVAQEFSDKGRGSLEAPSGADLYIGLQLDDGFESTSKGLFVQAKLARRLRTAAERADLHAQSRKLVDRTPASYIWLYGQTGVQTAFAQDLVDQPSLSPVRLANGRIADHISNAIACEEGDPAFGIPPEADLRQGLRLMLSEFAIPTGIGVAVERPVGVFRGRSG